jgi:hypothetical protein
MKPNVQLVTSGDFIDRKVKRDHHAAIKDLIVHCKIAAKEGSTTKLRCNSSLLQWHCQLTQTADCRECQQQFWWKSAIRLARFVKCYDAIIINMYGQQKLSTEI